MLKRHQLFIFVLSPISPLPKEQKKVKLQVPPVVIFSMSGSGGLHSIWLLLPSPLANPQTYRSPSKLQEICQSLLLVSKKLCTGHNCFLK